MRPVFRIAGVRQEYFGQFLGLVEGVRRWATRYDLWLWGELTKMSVLIRNVVAEGQYGWCGERVWLI